MEKNNYSPEKVKPASITFKTAPELKEALEELAKEGFRSLSAQVEMIVIKYLDDQGIDWREESGNKGKSKVISND
jgi:hypothetical protein